MIEQPTARAEVETGRFVLLSLPADPDSEIDATVGEDVECRQLFGEDDRPAEGREQDVRAETNPRRPGGHRGEHGQRLEPVAVRTGRLPSSLDAAGFGPAVRLEVLAVADVVRDDDPVDAGRVGGPRHVEEMVPVSGSFGGVGGQ